MRDEKRSSGAVWIVAAMLLVLPVVYVGSYLALVVPKGRIPAVALSQIYHYRVDSDWPVRSSGRWNN